MTAAHRHEGAEPRLTGAYAACEAITRRRARNFYYGLKLTPPSRRGAMYAVYAWMRQADDLADAAGLAEAQRRQRIAALRARTRQLFALAQNSQRGPDEREVGLESGRSKSGRSKSSWSDSAESRASSATEEQDSVWLAMEDTVRRFRLSIEPFEAMLDGQLEDIEHREYETFEELRRFCYRVASTVGLVCISIWGHRDPRARDLAIDRGIAFQLTNILRDVREDFSRDRVYLPREDFARHGLDPAALLEWRDDRRCRALILEQAERVEHLYSRSAELDSLIEPSCRPTLWAMTSIYHRLLEKIRANPRAIAGSRRIRLSCLTKGWIALRARRQARAALDEAPVPEAWRAGTS
jgi:phytoene synthase